MVVGIYLLGFLVSCTAASQEDPAKMFNELYEKYKKTAYISMPLEGGPDDGMGIFVFDINNELSEDVFSRFELFTSMGQTQYQVYKKDGENIWYVYKKVLFYASAYDVENIDETLNTYFIYKNNLPYAFNDKTGKYDIQVDTNKYLAIVDVPSLEYLIEVVKNATNIK
jgi:hypothetical protein